MRWAEQRTIAKEDRTIVGYVAFTQQSHVVFGAALYGVLLYILIQ